VTMLANTTGRSWFSCAMLRLAAGRCASIAYGARVVEDAAHCSELIAVCGTRRCSRLSWQLLLTAVLLGIAWMGKAP
jgi:hypothetical protein